MTLIQRRHPLRTLAALLAAVTTGVVAQPAATDPQSPAATLARADVREVCRNVDEQLQAMLARVVYADGASLVDVLFDVEGDRVRNVRTLHGQPAHQAATRRAVYRLACRSAPRTRQVVSMQVEFLDTEAPSPRGRGPDADGRRH